MRFIYYCSWGKVTPRDDYYQMIGMSALVIWVCAWMASAVIGMICFSAGLASREVCAAPFGILLLVGFFGVMSTMIVGVIRVVVIERRKYLELKRQGKHLEE